MKKLILILSVVFIGCETPTQHRQEEVKKNEITEYYFDGCQYIGYLGATENAHYLTHKGNCNNPIHSK